MPIVAHNSLPTFDGLRADGEAVLTRSEALSQDIRELHIGLLNMMPDAALTVTEQQFLRMAAGVVLYGGAQLLSLGPDILAMPVSSLWSA